MITYTSPVARRPGRIFLGGILDRHAPSALIVLRGPGYHVGQRKALGHRRRCRYLSGRRQVATVIASAAVVFQLNAFGCAQARIGKELVGALFTSVGDSRAVELLRDIDGCLALAGMNNGKGVVAQRALARLGFDHGRLPAGEELRTSCKSLGRAGRTRWPGGRRNANRSRSRARPARLVNLLAHCRAQASEEGLQLGVRGQQFAPSGKLGGRMQRHASGQGQRDACQAGRAARAGAGWVCVWSWAKQGSSPALSCAAGAWGHRPSSQAGAGTKRLAGRKAITRQ